MSMKYNSLEELKRKKALLKNEVSDLEKLLTFKNTKESLSAMTDGFTDQFLQEKVDENGKSKTALKTDTILKEFTSGVKEKVISKNAALGIANHAMKGGAMDELLKLGAVALVGNFAQKKMKSKGWKQKLIGLALIYVAPIALKFIREKLEQYQKNRSVSSMEKLI